MEPSEVGKAIHNPDAFPSCADQLGLWLLLSGSSCGSSYYNSQHAVSSSVKIKRLAKFSHPIKQTFISVLALLCHVRAHFRLFPPRVSYQNTRGSTCGCKRRVTATQLVLLQTAVSFSTAVLPRCWWAAVLTWRHMVHSGLRTPS